MLPPGWSGTNGRLPAAAAVGAEAEGLLPPARGAEGGSGLSPEGSMGGSQLERLRCAPELLVLRYKTQTIRQYVFLYCRPAARPRTAGIAVQYGRTCFVLQARGTPQNCWCCTSVHVFRTAGAWLIMRQLHNRQY